MKNLFSIESQEIFIWIKWDLFNSDLEVKIFHMNSSWIFQVSIAFSSSVHGFEAFHPRFIKFDSLSSYESHWDRIPTSYITHKHNQVFRKISQLVIFKLSYCDLSPPLELVTGESSKLRKMSYTHPNSIMLVSMGYRRQEEEMRKDTFWDFWADQLWPFNFQPDIFKFEYRFLLIWLGNWR